MMSDLAVHGKVLLVACSQYEDEAIPNLRSPQRDVVALAEVFNDREHGEFEVTMLFDERFPVVQQSIAQVLSQSSRDELVVLYLSCHGIREGNELYFAHRDAVAESISATSMPSIFLRDELFKYPGHKIIVLLDCCFSGAWAAGMKAASGDIGPKLEEIAGVGHVVITASTGTQFASEGKSSEGSHDREEQPSVFTAALVDALKTGRADQNRDGFVGFGELYQYVHDQVTKMSNTQTPMMWALAVRGEIYIARSQQGPAVVPQPEAIVRTPMATDPIALMARNSSLGLFLDVDDTLTNGLIQAMFARQLGCEQDYADIEAEFQRDRDALKFGRDLCLLFRQNNFTDKKAESLFQSVQLAPWADELLRLPMMHPVELYLVSNGPSYYVRRLASHYSIQPERVCCSDYRFDDDGVIQSCAAISDLQKAAFVMKYKSLHWITVGVGDDPDHDGPFLSQCDISLVRSKSIGGFLSVNHLGDVLQMVERLATSLLLVREQLLQVATKSQPPDFPNRLLR